MTFVVFQPLASGISFAWMAWCDYDKRDTCSGLPRSSGSGLFNLRLFSQWSSAISWLGGQILSLVNGSSVRTTVLIESTTSRHQNFKLSQGVSDLLLRCLFLSATPAAGSRSPLKRSAEEVAKDAVVAKKAVAVKTPAPPVSFDLDLDLRLGFLLFVCKWA